MSSKNSTFEIPFPDAETAWFWFIRARQASQDGARTGAGFGNVHRPCEPLDILRIVDRLYKQRILLIDHIRVLSHYGHRGHVPNPDYPNQTKSYKIWCDAMTRIAPELINKGIIQKQTQWDVAQCV